MDQAYEFQEDMELDIYEEIDSLIRTNPGTWQSVGAVLGLSGAVLSPVLGTLLIAVTWIIHTDRVVSSLNHICIVPFVLTIPLLIFGAHCLDLLERKTARRSLRNSSR